MTSPTPNTPQNKTPETDKSDEDGAPKAAAKSSGATSAVTKDAIELLKADHREVDQLFRQIDGAKGRRQRKKLFEKIACALTAHTIIEEEIFYPACRGKGVEHDELHEAQVEHDTVKLLVADLLQSSQDDDYYDAKVTVLGDYVKHHVGEEENPSDGIFARATSAGLDMAELGQKLQARKDELMSDEKRLIARPPKIRSLDLSQMTQEYGDMSRYPNDRHRDRDQENRSDGYRAGSAYRGNDYSSGRDSRGRGDDFYRGGYDDDFGPNRDTNGPSDYPRSSSGHRDPDQEPGYRNAEGGHNDRSDRSYGGPRDDDREYYQGTRYGSSYGGGRYRTENDDGEGYSGERDDRYYSGQGRGATRGGDLGGRGAYGGNSGRDDDTGSRDYGRRDLGAGRGTVGGGGRYPGNGSGFRGNR